MTGASNQKIADKLRELADLLEQQGANSFRVGAYRRAAETAAAHEEDLTAVLARDGLDRGEERLAMLAHLLLVLEQRSREAAPLVAAEQALLLQQLPLGLQLLSHALDLALQTLGAALAVEPPLLQLDA